MAVFRDFCRIVSGAVFALCVVFISNSSFAADYSIAYVLDDGVAGESQPTTAATGTSFNVSNPTKSGYTFAGWKITGMDTSSHTIGNTTTTNQTANLVTDTTFNNLRQTSGTVTFTAQWCQSCSATNGATCELQISENAETGELQCRYVTECQEEPTNLGYVIARADAYNPYCRIRCSAGTVVTGRYGTCTTPTTDFGWYKAAHWVTYGRISQYNYCMPGYNNTGTTSGYHDAKSDCKATIPAGHTVSSTTMPVRYVRATSNGSDKNTYTHMVEIQAFEANDGTGTNLLAGKGSTTSLKKATDGSWTRSNYASGASLVWDMGSVQNVGSIKFAMYTDGRTYHDVKISVSTDNTNWTDVLGPIELPTDYSSTPTGELIVLTGLPQSCSAGTYKAAQTISLNNSTGSCTACATGSYSAAGSGTCAPCPAGTYYDSNSCYSCSEETSGDFPYADIGASSIYQCYTTGTVNCATFNPYFGNGTPVYRNQTAPYKQYYDIDYEQPFILNDDTACDILSLSCDPGYTESSVGTYMQNIASKFVSAHTCALSGNSGACQDEDYNMGPGSIIGTFSESAEFQVVKGRLACTDVPGDDSSYTSRIRTDVSFNPALTTGAYCWGQATEIDDTPINASWFYWKQYNSIEECRNRCGFVSSGAERYALLNTFALTLENKMCIPEYTITYNLNGGTNYANAPTTYNSTTATITLGTPTKSGYEFGGWYDNSGLTGDAITQIENGSTGNKTLWAKWNNNAFTITTTSTDSFSFNMSASGNFVVDCGDGGTLSGDGVVGNAITRSGTTEATYTCEYPTAATHTITFTGTATGYSTASSTAAIKFNITDGDSDANAAKISSISGSLGAIFPTLNNGSNDLSKQPRFYYTFRGCTGLTSLPSDLFNGISGAATDMFSGTFYGCSGLTSLPSDLFNGISGAAAYMFQNTFLNCRGLTSLPSDLFNGISGAAYAMFSSTFYGCRGLTSLPSGLFNGISGAATSMFSGTFNGCNKLTSLPSDLFNGISGAANYMFQTTFNGCNKLTSLPSGLFNGISGAATSMFGSTFAGCSGLTSLPSGLFNGISGNATYMFSGTFSGCSGLTSVPYNLFSGASGTPGNYMFNYTFFLDSQLNTFVLADGTSTVNYIPAEFFGSISGGTNVMTGIFSGNTAIASSCPSGTAQNITGYESQWDGRVSCLPANTVTLYRNYDANDNTTLATITVVNGNAMPSTDASGTTLTAPTRIGYTFTGYYSARSDGTKYYNADMTSAATWPTATDGNLYAQWEIKPVTCSAGEYSHDGICTECAIGSYSAAGASECTPCSSGMTTSGTGKTSCDITCANSNSVASWTQAQWSASTNTVSNKCTVATCAQGYDVIRNTLPNGYTPVEYIQSSGESYINTGITPDDHTTMDIVWYTTNTGSNYISGARETKTSGILFAQSGSATDSTVLAPVNGVSLIAKTNNVKWSRLSSGQKYHTVLTTNNGTVNYYIYDYTNNRDFSASSSYTPMGTVTPTMHICAFNSYNISGGDVRIYQYRLTKSDQVVFNGVPAKNSSNVAGLYDTVSGTFFTSDTSTNFSAGPVLASFENLENQNACSLPEYTITYNLNGGTNYANAPTTYNPTTATIILGTPTRTGYTFAGWYDNSGFTGNAITQIPTGSTGNKTLYAHWVHPFTITTTATKSFKFKMSASGNFVVDCGNGGTLTSTADDVTNGNTVTRSNTTEATYTCSWGTSAAHTVTLDGIATGYSKAGATAAIKFNITDGNSDANAAKISSISGSLGAIFPTLNNGSNNLSKQPRFYYTFRGCTGLTSLPSGLFSGISGAADNMFYYTFYGCNNLTSLPAGLFNGIAGAADNMFSGTFGSCTSLTSLPSDLFNGISGAATYMFSGTFSGCTGLTSLPSGLFNGISGTANYMFGSTFYGCTGLTSLPSGLFNGISGAAQSMFSGTFSGCTGLTSLPSGLFNGISGNERYMFSSTFSNCSGLTSLPSDLFNGISGNATYMFSGTFSGCSGLTSLPSGLFNGISGAATSMFGSTFAGCSGLTSLPSGLFSGISGAANYMFQSTFSDCSGLTSVPYNLFASASGTPGNSMFKNTFYDDKKLNTFVLSDGTSTVNYIPAEFFGSISGGTNVMPDIFSGNTAIASSCPSGTVQNITGYESQWNGRVSCLPANTVTLYRNYDSNDNTTLATITVVNGNAMPSIDASGTTLTAPTRIGYTFTGYYSARSDGTKYYNADMTSAANWPTATDGNLYAQWEPNYITCSAGEYLTSNETCTICPAGSWCPATSVTYIPNGDDQGKTPCAAGTYQNQTGQSSCITAEAGYYVSGTGKTSQTSCNSNDPTTGRPYYQDETGQSSCKVCPEATGYAEGVVTGYWYYSSNNIRSSIGGCRAYIDVDDPAVESQVFSCAYNPASGLADNQHYGVVAGGSSLCMSSWALGRTCNTNYHNSTEGNIWSESAAAIVGKTCVGDEYNITYNLNGGDAIPSGYTPVEYIETDGNTNINTNTSGLNSGTWVIYVKWMQTAAPTANYAYVIGVANGASTENTYRIMTNKNTIGSYALNGNTKRSGGAVITTAPANVIHEGIIMDQAVLIDGNAFYPTTTGDPVSESSILKLSTNGFVGRYYAAYAQKDDVLQFNFVPVRRNSDNKCGMYDTVSGTFFSSSTSTDFTCPNVSSMPSTYVYAAGATINGTPTRTGYTFAGWTGSNGNTPQMSVTIGTTDTGNKSYTANWEEETEEEIVSFNCSDETNGEYPYTDPDASSIDDCYKIVTVSCASFNPYTFGNGTAIYRNQNGSYKQYYDSDIDVDDIVLDNENACDILSLSCNNGYANSSLFTNIPDNALSYVVDKAGCPLSGGTEDCENYNLEPGSLIVSFSQNANIQTTKGRVACTNVPGNSTNYKSRINTSVAFDPYDITGPYCWARAVEVDNTPVNASWFYWKQFNSADECEEECGKSLNTISEARDVMNTFGLTLRSEMCVAEYTITYNLNGGTNYANAPTTYNSTTATITLGTPTKSGYAFGGWYDNSGLTGNAITQIPIGSIGNKTLYAKWNNAFTITTTSTDSFSFNMSASGNFVVDCGDAGILSGDGVFGNAITRSSTTEATYTCEYPTAATHTITFTGTATGYSTANSTAAIRFNINNRTNDTNAPKISSISGSLGAIFSTLNNGSNDLSKQPRFYNTFYGSSRLTSLPSGLFSGISGAANYMFYSTFRGCSGLTSLPSGLFNGISGAANYMFGGTFYNCTGLTSLPSGLFNGISGAADYMFSNTFRGCTGLTSLPSGLFNGISGAANYMFQATFGGCTSLTSLPSGLFNGISGAADSMFQATFLDCTSLTSLPAGLFNGISGAADNMFESTFDGCSGLTSLPSDLFNGISGAATDMFSGTFYDCTGLTSLPSGLFNGISGAADSMFTQTFQNCSSLASLPSGLFNGISGSAQAMFNYTFSGCGGLTSVPYNLFAGASGTPGNYMFQRTFYNDSQLNTFILADGTSTVNYIPAEFFGSISGGTNVMPDIFYNNTAIASSCPNGTVQNITGYESQWNGRVSCLPANTVTLYRNYDSNDNTTLATITVVNGNAMPSIDASGTALTAPTRDGYTFTGYYSARTNGTQYYNTDMTSAANWTSDSDGNLYAQWGPNYITCSAGEYLTSNETCTICPVGYWCPATSVQYVPNGDDQGKTACAAGTYQNQTGQSSCITSESGYYVNTVAATSQTQCPIGTYSPAGSKKASQCGHILHIGDNENDVIYLHGDKDTNPSLNVSWGGQTWYANMVQQQTKATAGSDRYFNIEYDNQLFYVCDDTMCEVNSN